jgi:hypothetical protein
MTQKDGLMNNRLIVRALVALALLVLPIVAFVGCATHGNGDVVSCACEVSYLDYQNNPIPIGSYEVSLCESDSTDHTADAESTCAAIADKSAPNDQHQCACSCVHLVDRCER